MRYIKRPDGRPSVEATDMSKREKIILIIMALTVVYGFYALFLENPSPRTGNLVSSGSKLDEFNKFITNVAALTKDGLTEEDAYIIDQIAVKWTKDPLLNTQQSFAFKPEEEKKATVAESLGISYSGYLKMGDKSLAIINGLEYETGDELPEGGHVVDKIYADKLVIVTGGGRKKITVPLDETQ
jgi:hypothetical protein